jgi:hypothetical protein
VGQRIARLVNSYRVEKVTQDEVGHLDYPGCGYLGACPLLTVVPAMHTVLLAFQGKGQKFHSGCGDGNTVSSFISRVSCDGELWNGWVVPDGSLAHLGHRAVPARSQMASLLSSSSTSRSRSSLMSSTASSVTSDPSLA